MSMTQADWLDFGEYDVPDPDPNDVSDGMEPCHGCGSLQPPEWLDRDHDCATCAADAGKVHVPVGSGVHAP